MYTRQIILYGLGGAEKQYRSLCYYCIYDELISIKEIKYQAYLLKMRNPSVSMVFAIDNRYALKKDYINSYKENSIESCAIFKDLLEREGIRVL